MTFELRDAAVVIVEALDVIFFEVFAVL